MASLIFAYWAAKTKHPGALESPERQRIIIKRLVESGDNVSEMLYVVDGLVKDEHRMGRNGTSKKYDGITSIFRTRETVENLAGNIRAYRDGVPHETAEKYGL